MSEQNQEPTQVTESEATENVTVEQESSSPSADGSVETPQPKPKRGNKIEQESIPESPTPEEEILVDEGVEAPAPQMPSLSQMVLALPESTKQNIYDCMVSYVHNRMERDTILHSVFQKAEKALVEELHR
jgi:hypothetical protein